MQIEIINGPNLNLLGKREPEKYGHSSFEDYLSVLKSRYPAITFDYYQSNIEGEIINEIQKSGFSCDGIILNAGGYTHTSVSITDAIAAVTALLLKFILQIFQHVRISGIPVLSAEIVQEAYRVSGWIVTGLLLKHLLK